MTLPVKTETLSQQIIDDTHIRKLLAKTESADTTEVLEIIKKSKGLKGLSPEDVAVLLAVNDETLEEELFAAARFVKETIYGRRLVLFAPLYISNFCSNACRYCAFNTENRQIKRRALSQAEIVKEVQSLIASGHKRVLLVAGESHTKSHLEYICESIGTIYSTGDTNKIRRINVNIAPLESDGFKRLAAHNIGTYQLFQETYHRPTYAKMHTRGPKANFDFRLTAMDRAMSAGIEDVGVGVLFGLYDHRYEILALLQHIRHLEQTFGTGPHTISVPRLEPAAESNVAMNPPAPVSDREFEKLVAILRLAVPYTGIILSTRESPAMRTSALSLGVSQISAGSRTDPGGYCDDPSASAEPQFQLGDHRPLDEVIKDVLQQGYIPSFCTGCYRRGRTGQDFMDLAKPGLIKHYCLPNALFTLKEYLEDYAGEETKSIGERVIAAHLSDIPSPERRTQTEALLAQIETDKRDIYF